MSFYQSKITDYGYKEKVSVYNNSIEFSEETNTENLGLSLSRTNYKDMTESEKQKSDERRLRYYRRKVAELIEIALMNDDINTVITLTFKEAVTSYNYALAEWQLFLKRLRHICNCDLKYICVWEYQRERSQKEGIENGGIFHFHCLTNLGYMEHSILERTWGNGFVWIDELNNNKKREIAIRYTVKYCTKEITKRIESGEDIRGQRFFFTSNNLLKPKESVIDERIELSDIIFEHMEDMIRDGSYSIRNSKGQIINTVNYIEYKK
ncbi:MAG: hypothetical protein J1F18_07310 [Lachnospiraceae bacterium]|nr:hypothetical protein [Lachnospiraceae bacterium]